MLVDSEDPPTPPPLRCGDDSPDDLYGSLLGGPIAESSVLRFFFFSDLLELVRSDESDVFRWLPLPPPLLDEDFLTVDEEVAVVEDVLPVALLCGTAIGALVTLGEGNPLAATVPALVASGIISNPEPLIVGRGVFSRTAPPEGDTTLLAMGETAPSAGFPEGEPNDAFAMAATG